MLASGKADGNDDPLRELRKDLGKETLEEEEDIEHGKFNPLHVPGIPPGGGALPFGPGRRKQPSGPKDGKPATIAARTASGTRCSTYRATTCPGNAWQPGTCPGSVQRHAG